MENQRVECMTQLSRIDGKTINSNNSSSSSSSSKNTTNYSAAVNADGRWKMIMNFSLLVLVGVPFSVCARVCV